MDKTKRDAYYESLKVPLEEVYIRDHAICHLCNEFVPWPKASRDHVKPRSQGGPTKWHNIKLAHKRCNSLRGDRPVSEWRKSQKAKTKFQEWRDRVEAAISEANRPDQVAET